MNVALFGFMGVGKSTVGRVLARRLGYAFVDIDERVAEEAGASIPEIFSREGEAGFRRREREAVAEASRLSAAVISCGGGAVLDQANVETLRASSLMVLLTADPEEVLRRVGGGEGRPMLQGGDPEERVRSLLAARWGRYVAAADVIVDTTGVTPAEASESIAKELER